MTARPLAPVIPSSAVPSGRQRTRGRALTAAAGPPGTGTAGSRGCGLRDRPHRLIRPVTTALGWRGGDRLTLTADASVVTARRDPAGMLTLPGRAYIASTNL